MLDLTVYHNYIIYLKIRAGESDLGEQLDAPGKKLYLKDSLNKHHISLAALSYPKQIGKGLATRLSGAFVVAHALALQISINISTHWQQAGFPEVTTTLHPWKLSQINMYLESGASEKDVSFGKPRFFGLHELPGVHLSWAGGLLLYGWFKVLIEGRSQCCFSPWLWSACVIHTQYQYPTCWGMTFSTHWRLRSSHYHWT